MMPATAAGAAALRRSSSSRQDSSMAGQQQAQQQARSTEAAKSEACSRMPPCFDEKGFQSYICSKCHLPPGTTRRELQNIELHTGKSGSEYTF
jgi:hypothetical protein